MERKKLQIFAVIIDVLGCISTQNAHCTCHTTTYAINK